MIPRRLLSSFDVREVEQATMENTPGDEFQKSIIPKLGLGKTLVLRFSDGFSRSSFITTIQVCINYDEKEEGQAMKAAHRRNRNGVFCFHGGVMALDMKASRSDVQPTPTSSVHPSHSSSFPNCHAILPAVSRALSRSIKVA
ncbi:hypothetical protein KSS87_020057 [Heliosperma pusillum]|nr:hypothetical protein KSS87_020057 [Heliosperma pusillum]